jgi:pimeloyl-ACP methyl ester carboxylesterase
MSDYRVVRTADGRELEAVVAGPTDGDVLVWHVGTPSAAVPFPILEAAGADVGLRVVSYSRPGYGESTPHPGRTVADAATDTAAVLDDLGIDDFVTLGWSGGGPHALACAALLPGRCRAAAAIASVAPYQADIVWDDGMGPENVQEFGAALAGADALTEFLESAREELKDITADEFVDHLGGLVSDVDREAFTGEFAEFVAASFRRAMLNGIAGWRDDDLAFVADWGFDVRAIATPVSVWQGEQDRMVPYAHGQWLAAAIPGVRAHLYPEHGHGSFVGLYKTILEELVDIAV